MCRSQCERHSLFLFASLVPTLIADKIVTAPSHPCLFPGFLGVSCGALACLSGPEALFIPEGWWHQVTSSRGTVAINVWFKVQSPCHGKGIRILVFAIGVSDVVVVAVVAAAAVAALIVCTLVFSCSPSFARRQGRPD